MSADVGRSKAKDAATSGASTLLQGSLALVAAGFGGPLAGLAVSAVVSALGGAMSSKGDERVALVDARAAKEIQQRMTTGERPRDDEFFAEPENGRNAAVETVESLLLACRDEASERKLPYMSNLLCEIVFDDSISLDMAHQAISTVDQLTYRQFCILRLANTEDTDSLRSDDYRGQGEFSAEMYTLLQECADLYRTGLINFGTEVVFGPSDVKPAAMQTQGVGSLLHRLMRLNEIPTQDIEGVASLLQS